MLTYDLEKRGEQTLYGYLYERIRSDILSEGFSRTKSSPPKEPWRKIWKSVSKPWKMHMNSFWWRVM